MSKKRSIKVYGQSGYKYRETPTIMLKGMWLKEGLDYGVGDTVKHIKFGTGVVTDIAEGGRDYEVTVNFDKVGVKKMFASFAKLKKV